MGHPLPHLQLGCSSAYPHERTEPFSLCRLDEEQRRTEREARSGTRYRQCVSEDQTDENDGRDCDGKGEKSVEKIFEMHETKGPVEGGWQTRVNLAK